MFRCEEKMFRHEDQMSKWESIPDNYYQKIRILLDQIEKDNEIQILHAIENGSRLTGLSHDESDFDIRFIFKYNRCSLNNVTGRKMLDRRDTLEGFTDDRMLDWQGWCIDKAVEAIKQSNPSVIEWFGSTIVYRTFGEIENDFNLLINKMHNTKSLHHHYHNMARKNWDLFIRDKSIVLYKKYFYVLRPIMMIIYLMVQSNTGKKQVNDFFELLDLIKRFSEIHNMPKSHIMTSDVLKEINILIEIKKTNKNFEGNALPNLNQWIVDFFKNEQMMNNYEDNKNDLLVFQSLQSTYEKTINEVKKITLLTGKNGVVNRNDYLSLFGQYLSLIWLIQHPNKNQTPANIWTLLEEVKIDNELDMWIRDIILNKNEIVSDEITSSRISYGSFFINNILTFLNMMKDNTLIEKYNLISNQIKMGNMPRDDLIEHQIKNYVSLIHFIESSGTKRILAKDILYEKDASTILPDKFLESARNLIHTLRPTHVIQANQTLHQHLQSDVESRRQYVIDVSTKYSRKKELDKQVLMKGSCVTIEPTVFLELFEKYSSTVQ
jgi:predicted nucleotidyltransferase